MQSDNHTERCILFCLGLQSPDDDTQDAPSFAAAAVNSKPATSVTAQAPPTTATSITAQAPPTAVTKDTVHSTQSAPPTAGGVRHQHPPPVVTVTSQRVVETEVVEAPPEEATEEVWEELNLHILRKPGEMII